MLLLHLSDIHLRAPNCGRQDDRDRPLRVEIVRKVAEVAAVQGAINAILITGDIAFAGKATEYIAAEGWFREIAEAAGCRESDFYLVPGNHDVDRNVINSRKSTSNAIDAVLRENNFNDRDRALNGQLDDEETGDALIRSFSAYNDFARRYGCQFSRDSLIWTSDLRIDRLTVVRLRGLNSATLCGRIPENERGEVFLGGRQASVSSDYGVVNLLMAHHPPDWMFDKNEIEDSLLAKPNIALFGHTHRTEVLQRQSDCIVAEAGSANPDRAEAGWEPAFGIFRIIVPEETERRAANIRVWQYRWQRNPAGFVQVVQRNEGIPCDYKDFRLPIEGFNIEETETSPMKVESASIIESEKISTIARPLQRPNVRAILFRIWRMSVADRRAVFEATGLLSSEIDPADEDKIVKSALLTAAETNRLIELSEAISKIEK